jgi:hypothetical protein
MRSGKCICNFKQVATKCLHTPLSNFEHVHVLVSVLKVTTESARFKPILIHDPNTETGISESALLDKECLNLRLDF